MDLVVSDVGHPLRGWLLALAALLAFLAWTPSALAVGDPPVNSERPAISGNALRTDADGNTGGVDRCQPMTFAYQWRRCAADGTNCANIPGATALAYALGTADIGGRVHIRVTASNSDGSAAQRSWNSSVVVPPINTALPSLSGIARVEETLRDNDGNVARRSPDRVRVPVAALRLGRQ